MRVSTRILVLVLSTSPWERPWSSVAWIAARYLTMRYWSLTNASMRQRRAHEIHRSSASAPPL